MDVDYSIFFNPIVTEADSSWRSLRERHPVLFLYHNCKEFYATVRSQTENWRKSLFNIIRSECSDILTKEENALFILIFDHELTSIMYWKAAPGERCATWSTIIEAFLEFINAGMPFDDIAREVSNAVKRWKDKENYRREKVLSIDAITSNDPPIIDDISLEFEEFVETLLGLDVSENWLSTILSHFSISIHVQHSNMKKANDYQKKKTRDAIAQKVAKDLPELAHFIKERRLHKKRRSCRFP